MVDDFINILAELGFIVKYTMSGGSRIEVDNKIFHIMGASDETAAKRLQGLTLTGAFMDEGSASTAIVFRAVDGEIISAGC